MESSNHLNGAQPKSHTSRDQKKIIMKKYLIILAAACISIVSCTKVDPTTPITSATGVPQEAQESIQPVKKNFSTPPVKPIPDDDSNPTAK